MSYRKLTLVRATGSVLVALAVVACGSGDGDKDSDEDGGGGRAGSGGGESGGTAGGGGGDAGAGDGGTSSGGTSSGGTGSAGKGGSAGSGATGVGPALDAIEQACAADCEAQLALECAPPNQNRLTCQGQCASQTGQLGEFCLVEYGTYVACRAEGGYECLQGNPYPRATCASEQLAFTECTRNIGCKRACARAIGADCTDLSQDDCVDDCIAEKEAMPGNCGYYLDNLVYCEANASGDTMCSGDWLATPASCASSATRIAECLADEDVELCEAWCWAADRLGCGGSDCAADCSAKSEDETCGVAFLDMLDCATFFGDAACQDGVFLSNGICDSEAQTYQTCLEGGA